MYYRARVEFNNSNVSVPFENPTKQGLLNAMKDTLTSDRFKNDKIADIAIHKVEEAAHASYDELMTYGACKNNAGLQNLYNSWRATNTAIDSKFIWDSTSHEARQNFEAYIVSQNKLGINYFEDNLFLYTVGQVDLTRTQVKWLEGSTGLDNGGTGTISFITMQRLEDQYPEDSLDLNLLYSRWRAEGKKAAEGSTTPCTMQWGPELREDFKSFIEAEAGCDVIIDARTMRHLMHNYAKEV